MSFGYANRYYFLIKQSSKKDVEALLAKHPKLAPQIKQLSEADGTPSLKYVPWGVRQLLAGNDVEHVSKAIKLFNTNYNRLQVKDINAYKSVSDIIDIVEKLPNTKKEKDSASKSNAEKLYADEQITVIFPHDAEASKKYGAGTKWCVSAKVGNQFDNYSEDNYFLYFIFSNSLPSDFKKIAVSMLVNCTTGQIDVMGIFDSLDKSYSPESLIQRLEELNANKSIIEKLRDDIFPFLIHHAELNVLTPAAEKQADLANQITDEASLIYFLFETGAIENNKSLDKIPFMLHSSDFLKQKVPPNKDVFNFITEVLVSRFDTLSDEDQKEKVIEYIMQHSSAPTEDFSKILESSQSISLELTLQIMHLARGVKIPRHVAEIIFEKLVHAYDQSEVVKVFQHSMGHETQTMFLEFLLKGNRAYLKSILPIMDLRWVDLTALKESDFDMSN